MKCFRFLLIVGTLLSATTAFGDTIYNNTIPSGAASGLTGSQRTILIDDVLVPSSRNPSNFALAINSITVELSAAPGDSGQFSLYLFPVKSDGTPAPNFALIDTTSVVFTSSLQLVTFGTGAGTLFTVDLLQRRVRVVSHVSDVVLEPETDQGPRKGRLVEVNSNSHAGCSRRVVRSS
jgi:hypothetical protein